MKNQSEKIEEDSIKNKIIDAYADIVKNENMFPTRAELAARGCSRDTIRNHFGTLAGLRNAAKIKHPKVFEGVIVEDEILAANKLNTIDKKNKVFVITTVINGQWAHEGFLKSLNNYSKIRNATILLIPAHDPAHNLDHTIEWHFDEKLKKYQFIFDTLNLNDNIRISSLRINAKQINPTTGLGRICQGSGSFIFASPKQSLEYDPVSNVKMPHARMSTGACTLPNYNSNRVNSLRTAYIAQHDHVIGAIIVEVVDDEIYHFRQIQADEKGGFCDLGKYYLHDSKPKDVKSKLVMGDYHAGEHDESSIKAWEEIIDELKVDEVFFHDLFNGKSINHHEEFNIVLRAKNAKKGLLSLENEIKVTGKEIERILSHKSIKRGIIVKSNHDEFLSRWVENGKFKYDPINFQVGCRLADCLIEEENALKAALRIYGDVKNTIWKKLKFLERDEDYKVGGVECGAHGDKGNNGARGSKANIELAYGKAIIGHSHTPGILRGVFQVGTSSLLRLGYNLGASSWMHCSCLVYENGQRQLINSIGGKWRIKSNHNK